MSLRLSEELAVVHGCQQLAHCRYWRSFWEHPLSAMTCRSRGKFDHPPATVVFAAKAALRLVKLNSYNRPDTGASEGLLYGVSPGPNCSSACFQPTWGNARTGVVSSRSLRPFLEAPEIGRFSKSKCKGPYTHVCSAPLLQDADHALDIRHQEAVGVAPVAVLQ